MIAHVGEPPVVDEGEADIFSGYLRRAVPDTRRFLATQLRRSCRPTPSRAAGARRSPSTTAPYLLGNEVTPYLAQMALAGLADYDDEAECDEQA